MSRRIIPAVEVRCCDRCRAESFNYGDATIQVRRFWPDYGSPNYHAELDLCSECAKDLWQFVFGPDAKLLGDRDCDKIKEDK